METIFANNINDLYLISAVLSNSVIFNVLNDEKSLLFKAAILINGVRYMGSICINSLCDNINVSVGKLQFLSSITLNSNHEIEITTTDQLILCPIERIDLSFSYDEDDLA
jgi:hypothetical protein